MNLIEVLIQKAELLSLNYNNQRYFQIRQSYGYLGFKEVLIYNLSVLFLIISSGDTGIGCNMW